MQADVVFSGGGVKALAFIGVLQALEEYRITIRKVAGTSAGAVIGALVSAGYSSEDLIKMLPELSMFARAEQKMNRTPTILRWLLLYWKKGLYSGDGIKEWMDRKLFEKGIRYFEDLPYEKLRMIASDLTDGEMLVLPDDIKRYTNDKRHLTIAEAVRMSASLPFFYEPVKLKSGKEVHYIVDGGVLSNFPVFLFDEKEQQVPLFGFQLTAEEVGSTRKIDNVVELYEALFHTMKEAHDQRFIKKNPRLRWVVVKTPPIPTAGFQLKPEKMHALIRSGRAKTIEFIEKEGLK
ncbi:patatin-like phospholipase family protein [Jeotgalibacillus aurantiacus]|uniref:patatin-like phospholipase family protein n=1 Tax=Jeotgalibacillus aurantiacus TaxID=2763266 RepID=UPI001D0B2363|nr:patatin-like phospholipase family protein [Jeotgalibacillus aurantiacus]